MNHSQSSYPFQKIAVFSLITAPLSLLLGDWVWIALDVTVWGTIIRWISYVLLVPATISIAFHLHQQGAKTLALIGGWLSLFGIAGGVSILTLYRLGAVMDVTADGLPVAIEQAFAKNPLIPVSIFIPGTFFPLALLIFGIGLFYSNKSHWLPALAMFVCGVLFFVGNALEVVPALFACDLLIIIIFAWIARQMGLVFLGHPPANPGQLEISSQ